MSKNVTISIYDSNQSGDNKVACFIRSLQTDLSLEQIEELLDVDETYTIEITKGDNLCFIDYRCHGDFGDKIINIVNSISESSTPCVKPKIRHIRAHYNEDPENPLPTKGITVHYKYRYSKGAGSFADWIMTAQENPWFWLVLSVILVDIRNTIINIFKKRKEQPNFKSIPLNTKKLYSAAAKVLKCDKRDLQITSLEHKNKRIYTIILRHRNGESYRFECRKNGKIIDKIDVAKSYTQHLAEDILVNSAKWPNRVQKLDEYKKELDRLLWQEGVYISTADKDLHILKAVAKYEVNNRSSYIYFLLNFIVTPAAATIAIVALIILNGSSNFSDALVVIIIIYAFLVGFYFIRIAITTRVRNLKNELILEYCELIEKVRNSTASSSVEQ